MEEPQSFYNPIIHNLFEFKQNIITKGKRESIAEMRNLYEKVSNTYISQSDFIELLKQQNVKINTNNQTNIRMTKEWRKKYFS